MASAPDLVGAQGGGVVGRAVGVAGAGDEDDDAAAGEVARGAALDEGLGDAVHRDGGHHAHFQAGLLQPVHERQAVDDGREHPHVVARGAVGAVGARAGETAEDVAAADDDRHLRAELAEGLELLGEPVEHGRIDGFAGGVVAEGFPADLQHDAAVLGLLDGGGGHTGEMRDYPPSVNHALVTLDSPRRKALQ